ncbi:unnamed protein product [Notodromas monacha]|uniref:EGF-like domain-containing protein n=1 Tax=Notodromas monacha TaxID=399045 RepID=A0A7R9BCT9_9CRUS|nr:unnamed protein product [Notodromas monacha]CAG0912308.1 unnamed protein product [Notodromas monacha]
MCGTKPGLIMTEDINECILIPSLCPNGECINTQGSYTCSCYEGFKYNAQSNACDVRARADVKIKSLCELLTDENECLDPLKNACDEVAKCENMPGGFRCNCPGGYKLSRSGMMCDDIDECLVHSGICENGRCQNSAGAKLT